MPLGWKETNRQTPLNLPPSLVLERSGTPRGTLELTILWSPKAEPGFPSSDNIRALVISGQKAIREYSLEKELPLQPIQGAHGTGFYYTATDKTYKTPIGKPTPGEYPILTRGELGLGDLVVSFTLFSDAKDDAAVQEALTALKGATVGVW